MKERSTRTINKADFESNARAGATSSSAGTVPKTPVPPSSPYLKATLAFVEALNSGKTIFARISMEIWPHWVSLRIGKVCFEPSSWMPSSLARPRWTNLYVLA